MELMNTDDEVSKRKEEISQMLKFAKLDEIPFYPTTQIIEFSKNLSNDKYKFLELDEYLAKEISEGKNVILKEAPHDKVVLCTSSRTYDVKEAETSNSLLVTPNLKFQKDLENDSLEEIQTCEVLGIYHTYLEPRLSQAQISRLKEILQKTEYKGPEYEYEIDKRYLYSYCDLLNNVPMSEEEFQKALNELQTVELEGKIRLFSFEYLFRCISLMLKTIDEFGWNFNEVSLEDTIKSVEGLIPEAVVKKIFYLYTELADDNSQLYQYKEDKVCLLFAQVLLNNAGKFHLREFLQVWKESVPENMNPDLSMLDGFALVDSEANPPVIWEFREENLPDCLNDRFKVLFETKSKWTVAEITPYIRRLTTSKLDVNALLTKYARSSNVKGIKYFSAKHCK